MNLVDNSKDIMIIVDGITQAENNIQLMDDEKEHIVTINILQELSIVENS